MPRKRKETDAERRIREDADRAREFAAHERAHYAQLTRVGDEFFAESFRRFAAWDYSPAYLWHDGAGNLTVTWDETPHADAPAFPRGRERYQVGNWLRDASGRIPYLKG